jgi:hypothetical protein
VGLPSRCGFISTLVQARISTRRARRSELIKSRPRVIPSVASRSRLMTEHRPGGHGNDRAACFYDDWECARCPVLHAYIRISSEPQNQQIDLSLVGVPKYLKVRDTCTDERTRLAEVTCIAWHQRFNSVIEIQLKTVELLRMIDLARKNDVQDIEVCGKCIGERGSHRSRMSSFNRAIGCIENPPNIQHSGVENINVRTHRESGTA